MEGWNLVFRFPTVSEVGGENFFFMMGVLNSVWILVPAVEGEEPPCCNVRVGRVATWVLLGF
jgi:hypothetical protein